MAIHVKYGDCLDDAQLPAECIADCSASGSVDDAVDYWQRKLDFTVDRKSAEKYLRQTGGWDAAELAAEDDVTLARRVLWIACCDLREERASGQSEGEPLFCMEG